MKKHRKFAVIDSETPPFIFGREDLSPFLWGYFDGDEYQQFEKTADLVAFIKERDEIIYAHNGGKFDYHFLSDYFEPDSPIMLINGRIAKLKLGQCELRDSYNIIPAPLADFQKTKIDYSTFEADQRYKPENWGAIQSYLKDDCVDLYNLISAFIDKHGYALTQAGAAMKYFKKLYKVDVKTDAYFFDHFKNFYYGGRVQAFKRGIITTDFSVYDINSAYPYAMLENHWFDTKIVSKRKPIEYANQRPDAFFDVSCISDGIFPYRLQVGDKLIYPTDKKVRRYYVTGWEVKTALKWGLLSDITVHNVYVPDNTINFSDYILPIYKDRLAAKDAGDKANTLLLKLLMNSLYGKFGANPSNYTRAHLFDNTYFKKLSTTGVHWKDGRESQYRDDPLYLLGGQLGQTLIGQRDLYDFEKHYYNVGTAASITGYVRAYLYDAIMTTGRENCLYCDTDSIATTNGASLNTGKELGQWKYEGDFYEAAIAGRKMYAFYSQDGEHKTASKGVRLTANEIRSLAQGDKVTAQKDAPCFSTRFGMRYIERNIVATE